MSSLRPKQVPISLRIKYPDLVQTVKHTVLSVALALNKKCKAIRMLLLDYKNTFGHLD